MPRIVGQSHQEVSERLHSRYSDAVVETRLAHRSAAVPDEGSAGSEREFCLTDEWNLACRVAASKGLSKSTLLPKFLLHICEQRLRGDERLLTEQRIGTSIFNRAADYNPGEDNIVRSYARMLRRRLDEYFEAEGAREPMRITIPRGGYVPVFERAPLATSEPSGPLTASVVESHPPPPSQWAPQVESGESGEPRVSPSHPIHRSPWITPLCGFLAGLLLAGAGFVLYPSPPKRTPSLSHPLWLELFQQNRNTLIVPADSGLGILQNVSGHLISLEEYANGSYLSDAHAVAGVDAGSLADLREQRYTSMADLDIVARIIQLSEFSPARTEIRFARSITTEDLKTSNVILLGSAHSNPWVALFEGKLNFTLHYMPAVDQSFVLNERPMGTEQKQYFNGTGQKDNLTYGVIDYLPNLDGSGHVLLIQGLNMAATQAAAETLFNSDAMRPILKQAARQNSSSLRPFELLIKTSSIGATAPGLQIIAARFYA